MCLFLSPAVTLWRVAIVSSWSAGGQRLLPGSLSQRPGEGEREAWPAEHGRSHQHKSLLESSGCRAGAPSPLGRAHVHLLLSCWGIPGLEACKQSLSGTLRLGARFFIRVSPEHSAQPFTHPPVKTHHLSPSDTIIWLFPPGMLQQQPLKEVRRGSWDVAHGPADASAPF